jgi:Zn-dependent M16 (insulinase) family peptidase
VISSSKKLKLKREFKMTHLKNGTRYKNFQVTKALRLQELGLDLIELIHLNTQAKVLHLKNEDPENLFCLSFQTTPMNSKGVAHILEHTVLCGSKKYPVRDPFFSMKRRSLNTFMNAMTGSDFTCYPAASQVKKDFYNLLSVYLDAVFHPKLDLLSFLQEGHRLEFEEPLNQESPLLFKGIVFNEMKGALSNPYTRLLEEVNRQLFPDVTYGINSGGDPKEIPTLTHEELIAFHKTSYAPSRTLFYFYGDLETEEHLDFLEETVLKEAEKQPPLPPIQKQKRFDTRKRSHITYPIGDEENETDKTFAAAAFLTADVLQQEELLALQVLEIALLDNDASPLKAHLLKSGLCTQVSSYLETDEGEAPFILLFQGCQKESVSQIEEVLFKSLEKIASENLKEELIENALHQLEFERSEISGGSNPFGLSLFFRCCLMKQHGAEAEEGLLIHTLFNTLRERIRENPNLFTSLIAKYFLTNTHFVFTTMTPDKELSKKESEEEKQTLQSIRENLTPKEIETIIENSKALLQSQDEESEEDLSSLPNISLNDIPKNARDFPLKEEAHLTGKIFHHSCFTNHIVYATACFEMPYLKEEELQLARLAQILIPQMGTKKKSYQEILNEIQRETGGVMVSYALNTQASHCKTCLPYVYIQGKALKRKTPKLFHLLKELIEDTRFDDLNRLRDLLQKHHVSLENSLNQSALGYAISQSGKHISYPMYLSNAFSGLPYLNAIRSYVEKTDLAPLAEKLQEIYTRLFSSTTKTLLLSCDEESKNEIVEHNLFRLFEKNDSLFIPFDHTFESLKSSSGEGRVISSSVAFAAEVFGTVSFTDKDQAYLSIASNLFDNVFLHKEIREKGGAYGGGTSCQPVNGTLHFFSYRDPNIASTLKTFHEAIQKIASGDFTEKDLFEAKVETIQTLDTPINPGDRAKVAYDFLKRGQTIALRQAFRDALLSATKKDVIEAIKKHLVPKLSETTPVVFANRALFEEENRKLKNPLPLFNV